MLDTLYAFWVFFRLLLAAIGAKNTLGNMSLKILATADIHIGRRPSKLSDSESATDFSCARMWGAIVGRAIDEKVDLVALVGDIVDHDNRTFPRLGAWRALGRGDLDRLRWP